MDIKEIKDNIFQSSIIGTARVIIAIPLYLILTPFILNKLGMEDFAIWSFSTIIISLISLGDFGFKNSLIYYVAKNIESKNKQNIYFNNTLLIFIIIAISIITFTTLFSPYFSSTVLEVPVERIDKTIFVLNVIAISFALRFIATPYQAVIEAHQKIYYSHFAMIAWLVSNFLFTIIALSISSSIYYLAIASLLPNIIVFLMYYLKVRNDYNHIFININSISKSHLLEMAKYGSGIQIAGVAIAIREPILKILIARNADLIAVAAFELSYRLCIQAISIVKTPLLSVFSASAILSQDKENLNKIVPSFCNFNIAFLVPSTVFFFAFSSELINLWLGIGNEKTADILPFMFLSFSVYNLTEPLYKTMQASGRSYYSAILQSISIITCIFTYNLLKEYGHYSSAYALLITYSLVSLANIISFQIFFREVRSFKYFKSIILFLIGFLYVIYLPIDSTTLKPLSFFIYITIHFYLCKIFKIFDLIYLIKKSFNIVKSYRYKF